MRQQKSPQTYEHLERDFNNAVQKFCHARTIQRSFYRAYSRDENGDRDLSLIPQGILDFYSDEESDSGSVCVEWDENAGFHI